MLQISSSMYSMYIKSVPQAQSQPNIKKMIRRKPLKVKHIQALREKLCDIHSKKITVESNLWSACINYILCHYFGYKYSCYLIYMVIVWWVLRVHAVNY